VLGPAPQRYPKVTQQKKHKKEQPNIMTVKRKISVALSTLAAVTTIGSVVGAPAMSTIVSVASAQTVVTPNAAPPNILRNGAFVNPAFTGGYDFLEPGSKAIPGWSVGGGGVILYGNGDVQPPPGATHLVRVGWEGPGDISQAVDTTPGWTYLVKYWFAGVPNSGAPSTKTIHVLWGSVLAASPSTSITGKTQSNVGWTHHSVVVSATGTSSTLEFADASTGYPSMVGNISLVAEAKLFTPATLTLKGTHGTLVVYVRSLSGSPITDPYLTVALYGTWKPTSYAPSTTSELASVPLGNGQASLLVHLPSSLSHKTISGMVTLSGPEFLPTAQKLTIHVG
jgi:hypothetical protein